MTHAGSRWMLVALLGVVCSCTALADEPEYGFGGGGPALGLFMPDLTTINGFIARAGFAPFAGELLLVGGGGRAGTIPGPVIGGAGWGAWIESQEGDVHAEFGVGLGGPKLGFAIGGTERSALSIGALFGGGAAELILTEYPPIVYAAPRGIVVYPNQQTYDSIFAFIAPHVDVQIQLLSWIGLSVRVGYLWAPFELNWGDAGPLDPPDLAPSAPYVRFSIVFGGIGRSEPEASATGETTSP